MPGQESSAKVGAQRAAHARAIGLPALLDLVSRVEAAHKQVSLCGGTSQGLQSIGFAVEVRWLVCNSLGSGHCAPQLKQ